MISVRPGKLSLEYIEDGLMYFFRGIFVKHVKEAILSVEMYRVI